MITLFRISCCKGILIIDQYLAKIWTKVWCLVFLTHGVLRLKVVEGKLYTASHDSTIRVWDIGNIKADTQFGVDDKDSGPTSGAATQNAARPVPPSKTSKEKSRRDGDAPVKPAEKPRIMIGDEDDSKQSTKQGHLISIGKTTSAF